jgi:hypothetical protein
VVAVVQLSVQSPARRWEATDGIRVAIIIGATVVAGSEHQVADRITYRAGIAADICLPSSLVAHPTQMRWRACHLRRS